MERRDRVRERRKERTNRDYTESPSREYTNNNGGEKGGEKSGVRVSSKNNPSIVDINNLSPILIQGEMYIRDGKKWRLGEAFLSDKYLVFRITHGVNQPVQVQYKVSEIVLIRILHFAIYFDHNVFEIHNAKVLSDPKPGFPKLTRENATKKSIVTFRCANSDSLFEWISLIDDISDGVWYSEGMMPKKKEIMPSIQPCNPVLDVVGGPSSGSGGGAGSGGGSHHHTLNPPTPEAANSAQSHPLNWSISAPDDLRDY